MGNRAALYAGAVAAALLLSACGAPAVDPQPAAPEPTPVVEELPPADPITPEEGAQVLETLLGSVDEATGNTMSYGYDGSVTLDGTDYYSYRVSWLVEDHLSYLTSYLVSTDGLTVQEAPDP